MQRARMDTNLMRPPPPPPAKGRVAARAHEILKTSSHVPAARIRRHHSTARHT
ncbi:hypothetical protein M9458_005602, partial [Cirrhinus mrigala]